eukprot:759539-Hanusia_phi.AAC.1
MPTSLRSMEAIREQERDTGWRGRGWRAEASWDGTQRQDRVFTREEKHLNFTSSLPPPLPPPFFLLLSSSSSPPHSFSCASPASTRSSPLLSVPSVSLLLLSQLLSWSSPRLPRCQGVGPEVERVREDGERVDTGEGNRGKRRGGGGGGGGGGEGAKLTRRM